MCRPKHRLVWFAMACLTFVAASIVQIEAATKVFPIRHCQAIQDSSGQSRVLVGFDSLISLTGATILYAKLVVEVEPDTCGDELLIYA